MLLTIIICVIIADFITGLIHWIEDTYGTPSWPIIGKAVIEPNIEHHRNPTWVATMSDVFKRNWQTMVPAILACLIVLYFWGWLWPVFLTCLLAGMGNEVHAWNHRKDNPWWVKFLQDSGIMQSYKQHAQHHKKPYDKYFCTLTNFTNAVLELICFWKILEWIIATVFRIKPKRLSDERSGY